jgi:hypothetical protein
MKVDKIIFSSDDSKYLEFWPHVAEISIKKLGITPVLFHITDEESDFFEDDYGIVKKIKKIQGINTSNQAQIYRMYGTKWFSEDVCMISDIDMFFFNKKYLQNTITEISEEELVIIGSDAYDSSRPECVGILSGPDRYPICYVIGKGKTFNTILDTDRDFGDYIINVLSHGPNWDSDEMFFGKKVNNQNKVRINKIERGYSSNFHLNDRIEKYMFDDLRRFDDFHSFFKINLNGKINLKNYIDCHCKGPFSVYKDLILKIKNEILKP